MNDNIQYQLDKLPSGARRESVRLAIAMATDELALEHTNIKYLMVDQLADKPANVWGDVLPTPHTKRYFVRVALVSRDQLIRTIGHELFHVWQFENDVPHSEHEADKFGFELAAEIEWQMAMLATELSCSSAATVLSHGGVRCLRMIMSGSAQSVGGH